MCIVQVPQHQDDLFEWQQTYHKVEMCEPTLVQENSRNAKTRFAINAPSPHSLSVLIQAIVQSHFTSEDLSAGLC